MWWKKGTKAEKDPDTMRENGGRDYIGVKGG